MARPRLFSGMQPTGGLHIGNWLGALRTWVRLQDEGTYDSIFCVVDAHAITIEYQPAELRRRIVETATAYLASGIDPERSIVFVQSDVPEHTELAWYLATVTPMGELSRMTQFKEKSDEHKHNVNAGLFTYPILMAADVLLYRTRVVPVGEDQVQHLELAREVARRFNARFGDLFPEPMPRLSEAPRIRGVDGKAKMSKSRGNDIGLFEAPESIMKKLKGAFTDPDKLRLGDPGRPEVCNIFTLHGALSPADEIATIDAECRSGALGCGDCKRRLGERLVEELAPLRRRAEALSPDEVARVLVDGAERARSIAHETLAEVRSAMGLGAPGPARGG